MGHRRRVRARDVRPVRRPGAAAVAAHAVLVAAEVRIARVGPAERHLTIARGRLQAAGRRLERRRRADAGGPIRTAAAQRAQLEAVARAVAQPSHGVRDRGGVCAIHVRPPRPGAAAVVAHAVLIARDAVVCGVGPAERDRAVAGLSREARRRERHPAGARDRDLRAERPARADLVADGRQLAALAERAVEQHLYVLAQLGAERGLARGRVAAGVDAGREAAARLRARGDGSVGERLRLRGVEVGPELVAGLPRAVGGHARRIRCRGDLRRGYRNRAQLQVAHGRAARARDEPDRGAVTAVARQQRHAVESAGVDAVVRVLDGSDGGGEQRGAARLDVERLAAGDGHRARRHRRSGRLADPGAIASIRQLAVA